MTTKFKDLPIGQTFDFIGPDSMLNSFYEPCRKIDTLTYVAMDANGQDNPRYGKMRVGSASVPVYNVGRKAS